MRIEIIELTINKILIGELFIDDLKNWANFEEIQTEVEKRLAAQESEI